MRLRNGRFASETGFRSEAVPGSRSGLNYRCPLGLLESSITHIIQQFFKAGPMGVVIEIYVNHPGRGLI
jgi:hypothetical protein